MPRCVIFFRKLTAILIFINKIMIRKIILPLAGILVLLITVSMTRDSQEFPEKVATIIENSCQGCHNTDSKNEDAKEALDFLKWDEYKLTKKISLLTEICEVIEEDKMPPAKMLERNPDKALSEEDKEVICDWTKKETEVLMGSE